MKNKKLLYFGFLIASFASIDCFAASTDNSNDQEEIDSQDINDNDNDGNLSASDLEKPPIIEEIMPTQQEEPSDNLSDDALPVMDSEEDSNNQNIYDEKDDSGLSDGETAGIVAGSIAGAAAVGLAVYAGKSIYDKNKAEKLSNAENKLDATLKNLDNNLNDNKTSAASDTTDNQTEKRSVAEQDLYKGGNQSPVNAELEKAMNMRNQGTYTGGAPAAMNEALNEKVINVDPEEKVIKNFDPKKSAKGKFSGKEKIYIHQRVQGSEVAEKKFAAMSDEEKTKMMSGDSIQDDAKNTQAKTASELRERQERNARRLNRDGKVADGREAVLDLENNRQAQDEPPKSNRQRAAAFFRPKKAQDLTNEKPRSRKGFRAFRR